MKLLIVDDSSVIRRAIERGIESGEITEVDQAEDGEQAIQLYAEKQHDIITLDITMPKMDGLQVLSIVRRKFPEMRTVVLTSIMDEQFRSRVYGLGVDLLPRAQMTVGAAVVPLRMASFHTLSKLTTTVLYTVLWMRN